MPIKKSSLEQKWYYRVAKIVFLWAPVLFVATIILPKIILDMSGKALEEFGVVLQNNISLIVYSLIGLVLYFLILNGIWRGFLYVIFGGLEDDTKPKVIAAVPPTGQVNQPIIPQDSSAAVVNYLKEAERKKSDAVTWIILIIIFIWIAFYYSSTSSTPSSSTSGGGSVKTKTSTCIPTSCGSNWQCSGSYYSNNVQKSISGCYASKTSVTSLPSWSGMCRQCP